MNLAERLHAFHRFWRFRLRHDRHEIAHLRQQVAPGQTVLDIGANRGGYTYWMSKAVGPTGAVYAFEPQRELARYVEGVKQAFRLANVSVVNKALSCVNGDVEFFRPDCHPWGGGSLESFPEYEGAYVTVTAQRLDDFVEQELDLPRPIRFIKCDVQDHELQVLQGGAGVIQEDRPTLLLECTPKCWEALSGYLDSIGYLGTTVVMNQNTYRFDDPQWKEGYQVMHGNFVFVHHSRAGRLRAA